MNYAYATQLPTPSESDDRKMPQPPEADSPNKEPSRRRRLMCRTVAPLAAIVLSPLVIIGLVEMSDSAQKMIIDQNAKAIEKVTARAQGDLVIGEGVRVYLAPDTEGAHYDGPSGEYVDGNERSRTDTNGAEITVSGPYLYTDPDGEQWYGFTIDPDSDKPPAENTEWIKAAVLDQHRQDGSSYAQWEDGTFEAENIVKNRRQ